MLTLNNCFNSKAVFINYIIMIRAMNENFEPVIFTSDQNYDQTFCLI